jgi:hypothetical protein
MDVSAAVRAVESQAGAAVVRSRNETSVARVPDAAIDERRRAAPESHERRPRLDPSEGVAERAGAGVDRAAATDAADGSQELWIPAWVRVAYAARARRGWFLPAPSQLAGYSDDEPT